MNRNPVTTPPHRLRRSFHVVAKPIGARCNLDCAYCYYLHKKDLLPGAADGRIADDLLEEFIRQYITGQDLEPIAFSWHGGEPTLLGLDFFRRVVELQQKYADTKRIDNDVQTNGLLLDAAWCEFFREHKFLVGLSIDGPKHLHDRFRRNQRGEGSFDAACRAAGLLREHGVTFNILTVVSSANARRPEEVYQFLVEELGCLRLQWLPCVEPVDFRTTAPGRWDAARMPIVGTAAARPGHPASVVTDWSVDPDDWGEFLCRTFDIWRKSDVGRVRLNWFESLLARYAGQPAQLCSQAEVCGRGLVMESDGTVYACDHFAYPEYRLGKLNEDCRQLADMVYSPRQRRFGCNKRDTLPQYCRQCPCCFACNGDCPKTRFLKTPDGQPGLSYLCPGNKRFLTHADPHLRQLVAHLAANGGQM
jgi:uncharacterized protein